MFGGIFFFGLWRECWFHMIITIDKVIPGQRSKSQHVPNWRIVNNNNNNECVWCSHWYLIMLINKWIKMI